MVLRKDSPSWKLTCIWARHSKRWEAQLATNNMTISVSGRRCATSTTRLESEVVHGSILKLSGKRWRFNLERCPSLVESQEACSPTKTLARVKPNHTSGSPSDRCRLVAPTWHPWEIRKTLLTLHAQIPKVGYSHWTTKIIEAELQLSLMPKSRYQPLGVTPRTASPDSTEEQKSPCPMSRKSASSTCATKESFKRKLKICESRQNAIEAFRLRHLTWIKSSSWCQTSLFMGIKLTWQRSKLRGTLTLKTSGSNLCTIMMSQSSTLRWVRPWTKHLLSLRALLSETQIPALTLFTSRRTTTREAHTNLPQISVKGPKMGLVWGRYSP